MTDDDRKERGTRQSATTSWHPHCHSFFGAPYLTSFSCTLLLKTGCMNHEAREAGERMLPIPGHRISHPILRLNGWNLGSITPDGRKFPDFDENLRLAMRRETGLHFESMVTNNASVLDLIQANTPI